MFNKDNSEGRYARTTAPKMRFASPGVAKHASLNTTFTKSCGARRAAHDNKTTSISHGKRIAIISVAVICFGAAAVSAGTVSSLGLFARVNIDAASETAISTTASGVLLAPSPADIGAPSGSDSLEYEEPDVTEQAEQSFDTAKAIEKAVKKEKTDVKARVLAATKKMISKENAPDEDISFMSALGVSIIASGSSGTSAVRAADFTTPDMPSTPAEPSFTTRSEPRETAEASPRAMNEMQLSIKEPLLPNTNSEFVSSVQSRLMELRFMKKDEPTLHYGTETAAAIELFQDLNGFERDTTASVDTLRALFADDAKQYSVSFGAGQYTVIRIEKRLDTLGYDVTVDGVFDRNTADAVLAFQKMNGLAETGSVDADTRDLLFSEDAKDSDGKICGNTYIDKDERDERVQAFLDEAYKKLGCSYVWGGKGPRVFDCSGFVYYCLNKSGYDIRYMTSAGWRSSSFKKIKSMSDLEPGDICTYEGHVGIYIGGHKMIDASSSEGKIRITGNITRSSYWRSHWDGGRRIF